jgi:transcriptional regulator with XRE-family HTH domain
MKNRELLVAVAAGIRRCRARLGMTIEQLAEASGVDAGFLAHIETASKAPSLDLLAKILHGLDVDSAELFRAATGKKVTEQDGLDRRIQARLRGLRRGEKADVLAILTKLRRPAQIKGLRAMLGA